ncbi:MAG: CehA/McbA family metallohydrolase [Bryobacterales bacterium]|nr:CehA/McbA family metallohydrolase [Bryobacterales bacterium]
MSNLGRGWTVLSLALLAAMFIARDNLEVTSAADSEALTWGAIDPTWSPNGEHLGFSLFGSVWEVPAQGGEARQLTASAGYHAHPSWSPRGDQIVFVNGPAPRGRIPNINGELWLADIETGRERVLATPYPTAGTPAWSPDGKRIVCALQVPNAGALLYEIDAASGSAKALQARPQRTPTDRWIAAAWNGPHDEIFFAGRRSREPQVWSMPAGGAGTMIQMPLTKYLPEHIVQMGSVSALPDGSGAVYSAAEVNGKGDYELYRVSRAGTGRRPITNTTRDEFNPAVSPDGKRIAHVSNHMGNLDLFTMPIEGGEKKHVRISGLKFRKPSGTVRVKVLDEVGKPTPVRLYVEASDGKAYCPSGEQIFYYPLDPGKPRQGFFVGSGDDTIVVPAGKLRLVALKGIEYRVAERSVDVAADDTTELDITMERWTNWADRGWYTGENHFHANYNGSYYQRPNQSLAWLQAEDLNAANMIVANASGAFVHDKEFFTGAVDALSTSRYKLYWGEEYRNSAPLGHMGFLNLKELVPPFYTSVVGSDSPYDFPLNTMAAKEARAQGGLVTYMHPIRAPVSDVFDTALGAKESPVTAALGALDALDVLPHADASYSMWYTLLNAGLKISPGAGTDCFTNWRGINRIPGAARQYVHVGSKMDWARWIERYREGRAFVTNGPLIEFAVNGQGMGEVIQASADAPYRARIAAEITARVPLARIELLANGRVIETRGVSPSERTARVVTEAQVTKSTWFAVRVTGRPARGIDQIPRAHSGPVYVHIGRQPVLVKRDIELLVRWVDRLWLYLEERDNFGPGDNRQRAREMIDAARAHYTEKLRRAG